MRHVDDMDALPVAPSLLGESPLWHPTEAALYWCDIAGRCVKSCAGRPCPTGTTCSSAPARAASWLIAAPPAAKFATIWSVTSAG